MWKSVRIVFYTMLHNSASSVHFHHPHYFHIFLPIALHSSTSLFALYRFIFYTSFFFTLNEKSGRKKCMPFDMISHNYNVKNNHNRNGKKNVIYPCELPFQLIKYYLAWFQISIFMRIQFFPFILKVFFCHTLLHQRDVAKQSMCFDVIQSCLLLLC